MTSSTAALQPPIPSADLRRHGALRVAEHCLGRARVDRWWGGARAALRERVRAALAASGPGEVRPIERAGATSAREFVERYVKPGRPVLLEGAAADWACTNRWSPGFFAERYGETPIILMNMAPEQIDSGDYSPTHATLRQAIDALDRGNRSYCRFLPLLNDHPELAAELDRGWLISRRGSLAGPGNFQLFIGGRETQTATHNAIGCNLFVQIHGEKEWILYPPDWAVALDPPMTRSPYFFSKFDPADPDYESMPLCRHLRGLSVKMRPGDVLYNPPFWWHRVRNPTVSIGVGFRWYALGPVLGASVSQTLLTLLATNPPIWTAKRHKLDFTKVFTLTEDREDAA